MDTKSRETLSLDEDVDQVFGLANDTSAESDLEKDLSTEGQDTQVADATEEQNVQSDASAPDGIGERLRAPPKKDAQGRILDDQGNIVAGTKEEKTQFYALNRARAAAEFANKEATQLRSRVQQLEQFEALPRSLGLNPQDVTEALQFRAKIDSDPVNTVREIVARVLQNGYTMQQLFGEDAPSQINASIISQQLDQRLKPLTDRFAAQDREEQVEQRARQDLESFVSEHEYSDLHGEHIARIVQEHGISPEKAYYELRLAVTQRGLDFSKSIEEQMAQTTQQRTDTTTAQRATPGSRRPVQGNPALITEQRQAISPDTSFKDIVSMAIKSARQTNMNT